jgi:hypothetical protein
MNDCEVFWTSRITRPAWRIILGSWSGPKSSKARTETTMISGTENIAGGLFAAGSPSAPGQAAPSVVKIIYTRGNRTETLASLATLRKILSRFVAHRVFYEVSSRSKRGHEFFSAKNVFVVGSVEVTNYEHLKILIFDANSQAHSIEILNPQTMRIYDEMPGRGFAVSFISEGEGGVETRCYIRDEGEDADRIKQQTALEKISLPQLFEHLEGLIAVESNVR